MEGWEVKEDQVEVVLKSMRRWTSGFKYLVWLWNVECGREWSSERWRECVGGFLG